MTSLLILYRRKQHLNILRWGILMLTSTWSQSSVWTRSPWREKVGAAFWYPPDSQQSGDRPHCLLLSLAPGWGQTRAPRRPAPRQQWERRPSSAWCAPMRLQDATTGSWLVEAVKCSSKEQWKVVCVLKSFIFFLYFVSISQGGFWNFYCMQSPLRLEVSREEGGSFSGKERFLKATQTELELNRKYKLKRGNLVREQKVNVS